MKSELTWDALQVLLNSPIAFHRIFATIGGGATSGLFLSQLFYWTPRSTLGNGWVYKSVSEWEEETALTRYEQETIKKKLIASGLIEVDRRGVPATLHFRIVTEKFLQAISDAVKAKTLTGSQLGENQQTEFVEKPQSRGRKTSKLDKGKTTNKNTGNQKTITENIKDLREITQEISQQKNFDIFSKNDASFEPLAISASAALDGDGTAVSLLSGSGGGPNRVNTHPSTVAKEIAFQEPPHPKAPLPQSEAVTTLADTLIDRATAACKRTKNRLAGYQRQAIRAYPELAKNAIADLESEIRSGSVENSAQCLGGLLKVYLGDRYYEFVKPKAEKSEEGGERKKSKKKSESDSYRSEWEDWKAPEWMKRSDPDYRSEDQPKTETQPVIQSDSQSNPATPQTRKVWIPDHGEEVEVCNGDRFVVSKRSKSQLDDGKIQIYLFAETPEGELKQYRLEDCMPIRRSA